ncbi:MAG: leucine-rich repeat domain-containing protein [Muribaculaceae bacterium]|nr:leucine-rich repeat domain-containing protein [Muribaculaceae bacterium]
MRLKTIILMICGIFTTILNVGAEVSISDAPVLGDEFDVYSYKYPDKLLYTVKVINMNPREVAITHTNVGDVGEQIDEYVFYSLDAHRASNRAMLGSQIGSGQVMYDVVALGLDEDIIDPITEFDNTECTKEQIFRSFTIPKNIRFISDSFFVNIYCNKYIIKDNDFYSEENGIIFDKSGETLLHFPATANMNVYELPKSVKKIGPFSFANCKVSIKLHDDITEIPMGAFWEYKVPYFRFVDGLKKIGKYAFAFSNIEAIEFPAGLEEIGDYAFAEGPTLDPYRELARRENGHFQDYPFFLSGYYSAVRFVVFHGINKPIGKKAFDISRYYKLVEDEAHWDIEYDDYYNIIYKNWVKDRVLAGRWKISDSNPVFTYVFLSDKQEIEKGAFPDKPTGSDLKENTRMYETKDGGTWCDIYVPRNIGALNYYKKCVENNLLPEQANIVPSTDDYFFLSDYIEEGNWINDELQLSYQLICGEKMKPISVHWSVLDPFVVSCDQNGVVRPWSKDKSGKTEVYLRIVDGKGRRWNLSKTVRYTAGESGIDTVEEDASTDLSVKFPSDVYNLQGMKVGEDLNGLPAGIYICNGKKVMVR